MKYTIPGCAIKRLMKANGDLFSQSTGNFVGVARWCSDKRTPCRPATPFDRVFSWQLKYNRYQPSVFVTPPYRYGSMASLADAARGRLLCKCTHRPITASFTISLSMHFRGFPVLSLNVLSINHVCTNKGRDGKSDKRLIRTERKLPLFW